jgi:ribosome biogenesis GTPase
LVEDYAGEASVHPNGMIIEEHKNYYVVDLPEGPVFATPKGGLRKKRGIRLCVGDKVSVEVLNDDTREAVIHKVSKRETYIPRPPLANMDIAVVVCTLRKPNLVYETLDRFLFSAERHDFSPAVVFNKTDLLSPEEVCRLDEITAVYGKIGYEVGHCSAHTGEGIDSLIEQWKGRNAFLAGPSGVGKSSILERVFPEIEFETNELSPHLDRGVHTTTFTRLLPLPGGGHIADTPGYSFLDIPTIPEEEVGLYFPEIVARTGQCRFNNCVHLQEPGCSVRSDTETGEIADWRYENYKKFYQAMKERNQRRPEGFSRRTGK